MKASTSPRRGLRPGLVVLLVLAGFFIALPWLGCVSNARVLGGATPDDYFFWPRVCTFGFPGVQIAPTLAAPLGLPGFTGPYWGNLIVGSVYLVAAVYVAFTKRSWR